MKFYLNTENKRKHYITMSLKQKEEKGYYYNRKTFWGGSKFGQINEPYCLLLPSSNKTNFFVNL